MKKKLEWKSFSSFEEMSNFSDELFASLTPGQRLERFFVMLDFWQSLGIPPKKVEEGVFVLERKKNKK